MTAADVNGLTLDYELHGPDDGEPVLLIMGLGSGLEVWPAPFLEHLAGSGYRLITFDNRDVGLSSMVDAPAPTLGHLARALVSSKPVSAPYSLRDMADDAAGLLDHLGIGAAHVIGVSMGGMIAQELVIGHPHRVATLTSIMSNTGKRGKGAPAPSLLPKLAKLRSDGASASEDDAIELGRLIAGPVFDEDAARALYAVALARTPDRAAAADGLARQTLAVLNTRDRTADLRRVQVPTLVVHGLADRLVRPSGGMATARAVPGARLVIYPDMGHDVPDARTAELTAEILVNFSRSPLGLASLPAGR